MKRVSLAESVSRLRKSGAIITARPSNRPVVVGTVSARDSADFLEAALWRSRIFNEKVIASAPPFLRGRDERVMPRDSFGRIKSKAAGGKR